MSGLAFFVYLPQKYSSDLEMQPQSSMFHIYSVLREEHKFTKLHFTLKHKKQFASGNISSVSTKF